MGCAAGQKESTEGPKTRRIASQPLSGKSSLTTDPRSEESSSRASAYEVIRIVFKSLLPFSQGASSSSPKARRSHTLVTIGDHTLLMFGGLCTSDDRLTDPNSFKQSKENPGVSSNVFAYSVRNLTWTTPSPQGELPPARAVHVSVVWDDNMYVFGSHNHKDSRLYRYSPGFQRWSAVEASGSIPPSASGSSACVAGNLLLVLGGDEGGTNISNRLYAFDFPTSVWSIIEDTRNEMHVLARRDHSAVVYEDKMYVYGGFSHVSDDLTFIQFNAYTRSWQSVAVDEASPVPEHRGGHSCALYHHFMMIFGGMHHRKYLNDLHVYNIKTQTWVEIEVGATARFSVPMRRAFSASTICGHQWFIHGGGDEAHLFRDLFAVDANEVSRAAEPGWQAPTGAITDDDVAFGRSASSPTTDRDAPFPKKLQVGDKGYNRFNVIKVSPAWADVVSRSTRPVITM